MTSSAQPAPKAALPAPVSTPSEARRLAEGLMEVMSALLGIIEQETELVRAGSVRDAMGLEAKKAEASQRYMAALTQLKDNSDYFSKTTPELLTALHRHHDVFRAMLQANLTVLATAHAVSEGLVRGVNSEIQRKNLPQGYTAAGQRAQPAPRRAAPLAVSRVL
ncbi:hypothetical protein ACSVBT_05695 [Afipia sp. TerB]